MTEQAKIVGDERATSDTLVRDGKTLRLDPADHAAPARRLPGDRGATQAPAGPPDGLHLFHITPLQPCPYLPERMERKLWTDLAGRSGTEFSHLTQRGFRRSHRIAYRPACPRCNACTPVRVDVANFRWTRNLRRVRRACDGFSITERPAVATAAQYELFTRYLDARHGDGEMAAMSQQDYRQMVEEAPDEARVLELSDSDGTLLAACLMDALEDGVSAVYSFFDPDLPRLSLGTRMIRALVELAAVRGLPYVYLGYWVEGSDKMRYKGRFRPLEILAGNQWIPFAPLVAGER